MTFIAFFLLLLVACSPSSIEDFQLEGQSIARKMATELQTVQTREEIQQVAPKIKKRFTELVAVMIAARKFQQKYPEESASDLSAIDVATSDMLLYELKRIYGLEGGREMMEKAAREAVIHLDAFERQLTKQHQRLK